MKLKTEFTFDAAHRLVGYKGKCKNLHGHIWHVDIEVEGDIKQCDNTGILWDFTNAKKIKELFDHKTILKECDENKDLIELLAKEGNEMYLMEHNPTAEYLAREILWELINQKNLLKYKIKVWESPKSYVEEKS